MSGWIERVSGLFGGRTAAARPPGPRVPAAAPNPVPDAWTAFDLRPPFFEWLLDLGPTLDQPLSDDERRLLARLDELIGSDAAHAGLLPRAPSVIPQLLSCLRDQTLSNDALARRVTKDAHLVAEAIRLANGVGSRSIEPVSTLPEAINRLGIAGLQRVIARVLLKPIFDAQSDALSARAAPRLWAHSEAQANVCMLLAGEAGLDPFDGYLAGLMHNVGWSASLRAIDRCDGQRATRFTRAFVHALEPRRERMFAVLARPWQLSPAITTLANEVLAGVPTPQRCALGRGLIEADRVAALQVLGIAELPALTDD